MGEKSNDKEVKQINRKLRIAQGLITIVFIIICVLINRQLYLNGYKALAVSVIIGIIAGITYFSYDKYIAKRF